MGPTAIASEAKQSSCRAVTGFALDCGVATRIAMTG
jgi:hypothetical protein